MAQLNMSGTWYATDGEHTVAYIKQLKDNTIKDYVDNLSQKEQGRVPSDIKAAAGVFQKRLNEFFLRGWLDFQSFLLDEGVDPTIIDSWKEVQDFLAGLPDDETMWLKNKLTALDTAIAGIDQDGIGTFDVSAYNNSGGVYAQFTSLADALADVPTEAKKPGMTIRYIDYASGEYVQYRYLGTAVSGTPDPFTNTANWTKGGVFSTGEKVDEVGIDDEPTAGSENLVKSDGVYGVIEEMHEKVGGKNYYKEEVSQSGRSNTYDIAVSSGYTVKVTLVNCPTTFSTGIRIRGLKGTTPESYVQFGYLTAVGQTLTKILTTDIVGIDTYNNDGVSGSSYRIEWEKDITGTVNEDIAEINSALGVITPEVEKIVGIENNIGTLNKEVVYDISGSGDVYTDLASAISGTNVPTSARSGGMNVRFLIQTFDVTRSTVSSQPSGTVLSNYVNIPTGTYVASELTAFASLPTSGSKTYYISNGKETPTYTKWVVAYNAASKCKYVQYRLNSNAWSENASDWIGVDKEIVSGSKNLVESGAVASALTKLYAKVDTAVAYDYKIIAYNDFGRKISMSDSSNAYFITEPISIPSHSTICTYAAGVNSRISKVVEDGGTTLYVPLVVGINNKTACVSWTNNSDDTVTVVLCYLDTSGQGISAYLYNDVFGYILGKIPNIELYGKLDETTPNLTMLSGSVSNGTINTSSSSYVHSGAFYANKNDLIVLVNSRSAVNVALLYRTDSNSTFAEHIIPGVEGTTVQYRYYVCKESGYYGISGPSNYIGMWKYTPANGYVKTASEDEKRNIGINYTGSSSITISDAPYCQITKSAAVKISGSGDCTITGTLAESVIGRCFSIGLKIPYATQNVADVTVNGATFNKAVDDNRTLSGKSYEVEGDHFHRVNYNIKYALLSSFTIVIESETEWVIEVSTEGVVNDDLPLTPILVGYDRARDYPATFPYEGENISIYELHKRLQIPYYVSLTAESTVVADNAEIREAIESGLCEPVFYSGGSGLVPYWNATDGSLAQQVFIRKAAVGTCGGMLVVSQHVMDRNMYSNFLNSGVKILRHHSMFAERSSGFSEKYGDNEVLYAHSSGLGATTVSNFLRLPQVFYAHGVGTPTDPDDPYAQTHYVDRDGTNTKALFAMWKTMQAQGRVMVMKPSDWLDYCRQHP